MSRPSPLAPCPAVALLCAFALAVACNRGGGYGGGGYAEGGDSAVAQQSNGEITLAADGTVHGEVTSAEYRRWLAAREALAGVRGARIPSAAQLRSFDADDVQRAVASLERNAAAKAAIENAGLTVRDFVLTGVALERQLALTSGTPIEAEAPPPPEPLSVPMPDPVADMAPMPQMPAPMPHESHPPHHATYPPPAYPDSVDAGMMDSMPPARTHRDSTPALPRPDSTVLPRTTPLPPPPPTPDTSSPPPDG